MTYSFGVRNEHEERQAQSYLDFKVVVRCVVRTTTACQNISFTIHQQVKLFLPDTVQIYHSTNQP